MSDGNRIGTEYGTTEEVTNTHSYDLDCETASLVVVTGPDAGLRARLDDRPTTVGRARGVDIQLEDSGVSSRHLRVFEQSNSIWVEDLDSSNGTYVSGEAIEEPRELLEGDTIGIGRETLICLTIGEEGHGDGTDEEPTLTVGAGAHWFCVDDADPVDLRRRGTIRRILEALVDAADGASAAPIGVHDLFEIGWPDQEVMPETAAQRVYQAVKTLRRNGLSGILVTSDEGYYLATDVSSIERKPDSAQPPT